MADFTKHEIIEIVQDNVIEDTGVASDKVYSSEKTQDEIDTLAENVAGVNNAPSRLFLYYNFY